MSDQKYLICLVDDDEGVRGAFRFLLRTHGFAVSDYATPVAFLESKEIEQGDCFVLDIHMPGLSGLELLGQLRKRGIATPAIIVTGRDDSLLRKQAESFGAAAFLAKPVESSQLLNTIRDVIAAAQTRH